MQKRIGYIDMAKGLAIILVIIGHITFTPKTGRTIVYLFHIPLFFFSGSCRGSRLRASHRPAPRRGWPASASASWASCP